MSAKHTPGPWYVVPTLTGAISINKDKTVPVATVGGASWHLGQEVCDANARLIAAAPDLLAALQDACASIEVQAVTARYYGNIPLADELTRNAKMYRTAIAKATGGQQ